MEIAKSTRHQKIIGDYGENLICNWLSRSGFEVTIVDHTGIDIIAFNPKSKKRIGMTVKSRTRLSGTEKETVNIFSYRNNKDDREKTLPACITFACEPWIAIYVETKESADIYLTSLKNYDKKYRGNTNKANDDWKMTKLAKMKYDKDPGVKHICMNFNSTNWTWF